VKLSDLAEELPIQIWVFEKEELRWYEIKTA
jgi:hypothetical protein